MAISRRAVLAGLGASALLTGCGGGVRHPAPQRPVLLRTFPIKSFDPASAETRFGALEFLSGVELECDDPDFGGLSAFRLDTLGVRFLSLSDRGTWFSGALIYDADRIIAVGGTILGPIRGPDGVPLATLWQHDTESLALDGTTAYVGVENDNQIYKFDISDGAMEAHGTALALPPEAQQLHPLYGFESLAIMPVQSDTPGALLAIAEEDPAMQGRTPGWILSETAPPKRLTIVKHDRFRISDCAFLPDGDLLLLERTLSIWAPLQIRLRRIPLAELKDGAVIEGRVIFGADASLQIDNIEAISVHTLPTGETIVTMVSDNNFSILQRTLILQWKLVDNAA
jgi:hypothetical protein